MRSATATGARQLPRLPDFAGELCRRLVADGAQRIYLFGSWARGEADEDSDGDLVVIQDTPLPFLRVPRHRVFPGAASRREGAEVGSLLPSGYPHQFYGRETAEKAIAASRRILAAVEQFYRERHVEWPQGE